MASDMISYGEANSQPLLVTFSVNYPLSFFFIYTPEMFNINILIYGSTEITQAEKGPQASFWAPLRVIFQMNLTCARTYHVIQLSGECVLGAKRAGG